MQLIRRLHDNWEQQKDKYLQTKEYKIIYLTSVCVVLAEAEDLGSRMAMIFFEKALAPFIKAVHLSLFNPRTAATLAQSIFSPLAITSAMVPSTPIFRLDWRCAKAGSPLSVKLLARSSNLSGSAAFGKKCGNMRSSANRPAFKQSRAKVQFISRIERVSRRASSSKSWFLVYISPIFSAEKRGTFQYKYEGGISKQTKGDERKTKHYSRI